MNVGLSFPSPLVGEGGCDALASQTGEGCSLSTRTYPSSGTDFVRATFSHKGRREKFTVSIGDDP
jgi:hypothetical protein